MALKSLLDSQQPLHFQPALPSIAVSLKSCNTCHSEILDLFCSNVHSSIEKESTALSTKHVSNAGANRIEPLCGFKLPRSSHEGGTWPSVIRFAETGNYFSQFTVKQLSVCKVKIYVDITVSVLKHQQLNMSLKRLCIIL